MNRHAPIRDVKQTFLGSEATRATSDWGWVAVMGATTLVELAWWCWAWKAGIAPPPFVFSYLLIAFGALGVVLAIRQILRPAGSLPVLLTLFVATALVGVGASLFLPLKYAIPREVPFWLDQPLAALELRAFGAQPWFLLDRIFGWAAVPIDRVYGLWLPVQLLALFAVMVQPPSPAKSRALVAYSLSWFLLGVVAAAFFSSAGPIFYDRLYGGEEFAGLRSTLLARGATYVLAESDAMWTSFASGRPGFVAGMSAVPSLHVAISVWMVLAARSLAPRAAPFALAYCIFMWVASVQLGWHYVSDGAAGVVGAGALWWLAAIGQARAKRPGQARCRHAAPPRS
jgi:hypothetical protein